MNNPQRWTKAKIEARNKQIRILRKMLKGLATHLNTAEVNPPIPEKYTKWMSAEIRKLRRH